MKCNLLSILTILFLLSACAGTPTALPATRTAAPTTTDIPPSETVIIPSLTVLATDTLTRTATSTAAQKSGPVTIYSLEMTPVLTPSPLSQEGPWLVVRTPGETGLTAFNMNGTGGVPLKNPDQLTLSIGYYSQPGGHWLALRGGKDPDKGAGIFFNWRSSIKMCFHTLNFTKSIKMRFSIIFIISLS